jgi:hypothetical protein
MAGSHTVSRSQALTDARQFDVIAALRGTYRDHVGAMKSTNNKLILLVYMNGTYAQKDEGSKFSEDWYARDTNGNKIRSNAFGNYLMDPSHPGWIDNRLAQCKTFLAYSGYDGCILDMLGTAPLGANYGTGLPVNPHTGEIWTDDEWWAATSSLAETIEDAVGPAKVYGNGLGSGTEYYAGSRQLLTKLDGGMAESFIRAGSSSLTKYRSESKWRRDVDMLANAAARGRSIIVTTKTWVSGTKAQKDAWHRFALASFLLGDGGTGKSLFVFLADRPGDATAWHPYWDTDLGLPLGSYYQDGGVYVRDFERGKVVVNPTGSRLTHALGGSYSTLDGATVSVVNLDAHRAAILRRP